MTQLELLDKELSIALAHLRYQRNSVLPIMRVPFEIYGMIFEALQAEIFQDAADHARESFPVRLHPFIHPRYWMYIRLVCRQWRDIIDAHPGLWTTVLAGGTFPDALTTPFLRKSRQSPLAVRVDFNRAERKNVLAHISRIRDLILSIPNPPNKDILPLLVKSAPVLQTLVLSMLVPATGALLVDPSQILQTLFNNDMPMLRSLEIQVFVFSNLSVFRNLRQLRLRSLELYDDWPGVARLLQRSVPTLEDLTLSDIVGGADDDAPSPLPRVRFPRLKKLVLDDIDMDSMATLLKVIEFPADAPLLLCYHASTGAWAGDVNQVAELFRIGGRLGDANLAHLLEDTTKVQIHVGIDYHDVYTSGSTFAFHFKLSVPIPRPLHHLPLSRITRLHKAQELWLDGVNPEGSVAHIRQDCRNIIQQAPNIVKLYCTLRAELWIDALRSGTSTTHVCCPLLREIHLLDPRDAICSKTFLMKLVEHLLIRKKLETLYIYRIGDLYPLESLDEESDEIQEPSAQAWDEWQATVAASVKHLKTKVEFVELEWAMRPRMQPPAHCMVQSGSEKWQWQTWAAEW